MPRSSTVHTPHAPALPWLSQAVAAGDLVLTSGQVGADPDTGHVPENFTDEVRQALRNIEEVLRAADCTLSDVMRTFCILTDTAYLAAFNDEYIKWFPDAKPARTSIIAGLVGSFRFEIEATAIRSNP
ncbi:RidA family protein [Pseudarthrobacter sulfonivorans]|nr:RidA family protein [Pseudarthrobacter sulfonivorans]